MTSVGGLEESVSVKVEVGLEEGVPTEPNAAVEAEVKAGEMGKWNHRGEEMGVEEKAWYAPKGNAETETVGLNWDRIGVTGVL